MIAARFPAPGTIEVGEAPDPEPGPGEVLVRVRAAGICGGDLHEYRAGRRLYPAPFPRPPQGHELAGDVVALGAGVTTTRLGARVAVQPMIGCGRCASCLHGRFALCPELEHVGVARPGGFAELCAMPAANVHELPDDVSYAEGALLDCVAVAVHAVHRVPIPAGARVAVIGAGAIGLAIAQVARAAGAGHVVVVATRARPLEVARRLGADEALDAAAGPASGDAEVVFETAGGPGMIGRAMGWAAPGAGLGLVGESFAPEAIDPAGAMERELTLAFVWSHGSWAGRSEYVRALDLVAGGRVRLAPAITHRRPLAQIAAAFADAADRARSDAIKVLVEP